MRAFASKAKVAVAAVRETETIAALSKMFGGQSGYLIASHAAAWHIAKEEHVAQATPTETTCFRPLAIFDMNADHRPEVVMRFSGGDGWNDVVLSENAAGEWVVVATSNGGSTA